MLGSDVSLFQPCIWVHLGFLTIKYKQLSIFRMYLNERKSDMKISEFTL